MVDDPKECLDLFLRRVDELRATKLIQSGALSDAFHFGTTAGGPAILSVSVPDEDYFRSFLLAFRHPVAAKEPATLDRVANVLLQQLGHNRLREATLQAREVWRRERKHGSMRLIIDGRDYGPERVVDLYFNGRYFHSDSSKADALGSAGAIGERLTRQQLNAMLVAGVNYASRLQWIVITGRREGLLAC
jgi:hypothetical protein